MKEIVQYPHGFSTEKEPTRLSHEQVEKFVHILKLAGEARAYPDQSGYFVKTAGMAADGTSWSGGNKEYGHSDAFIHGETAVVSGLRDLTEAPIEVIAWFKDGEVGPNDFGRPCGNCRDILKKYCSPETVLLTGNEKSFVYTKFKDFLFENFRPLNLDHVKSEHVYVGIGAARGGNDIYLPEKMKPNMYGAAIVSYEGNTWQGKHYTNVGYDSVTPLLGAVINWSNSYPNGEISKSHLMLNKVILVSEAGIPDVFYRDRQAILELDEIVRKYTKRTIPLKIDLVHAKVMPNRNLIIYDAKRTNTEEWLPFPFSPGAFRMDDVMNAQLKKLTGK